LYYYLKYLLLKPAPPPTPPAGVSSPQMYVPIVQKIPFRPTIGQKPALDSHIASYSPVSTLKLNELIVHPGFKFYENFEPKPGEQYVKEFLHYWTAPTVEIRHAGHGVKSYYYVPQDAAKLVRTFTPGAAPPNLSSLSPEVISGLVQAEVLVDSKHVDVQAQLWRSVVEISFKKLKQEGYCVIKDLLNPLQLDFLREYHRAILAEFAGGQKITVQNHSWNDENVARYFNHDFTNLVSKMSGERLCHSSLALTLWIHPGPGFMMHTDTNPPFDITLDIAVDHVGNTPRTLNFVKKNPKGGVPVVESLNLKIGESVLFRGSEIPHFGGDLPENHYHNVILFTWEYVRD